MDKKEALSFLLKARSKTYAGGKGEVRPVFPKLHQLEYREKDFLYRDIYNMGNGIFMGFENVYFKNKPVISTSYFGNFVKTTEEEVDKILRRALIENWETTRLWHNVEWKSKNYTYLCEADTSSGSLDEFSGSEKILKDTKQIYYFYYAGGFIG
ncbi:MAG: hypothetical protein HYY87_02450 [Candidatus Levybacteria bacterium]|nr:hypothetical protein [Candidatus Levybacteria bacterium]MBI3070141.1 hypothetical protein [Candidatus Levybacteria bacterium]MBI3092838.1 hypothetical protein [Candidatus Levybacteria bacterium]